MRLRDLLPGCDLGTEISGLADNSTEVRRGDLFFALEGSRSHGLAFSRQAEAGGAAAIVFDPREGGAPQDLTIPCVAVPGLSSKVGEIASSFYGHPSRDLEIIGITGTNGKTSCSFFLAQALGGAVIGTLGWGVWPELEPTRHTTAPAIETQRRLQALRKRGIKTVAMEVSSHALDQGRVNGVAFDFALWTNLSRDHLDYHGSLDAYARAKRRLMDWPGLKAAVVNLDDSRCREFTSDLKKPLWGFGWQPSGPVAFPQLLARQVRFLQDRIKFEAWLGGMREKVRLPLVGTGNLANVLAVMAVLIARGASLSEAAARVAKLHPVPGRMERFQWQRRPLVVVDYAHTPAALASALESLRRHTRGRLWLVFGCGGDRDRGKRPQMGAVAETLADRVILTNDNPRHEDPEQIFRDIEDGMQRKPQVIHDRARAIETAVRSAQSDDIVLVAGKGHEEYQEVAGEYKAFSDRRLVASLLQEEVPCV